MKFYQINYIIIVKYIKLLTCLRSYNEIIIFKPKGIDFSRYDLCDSPLNLQIRITPINVNSISGEILCT